MRRRASHTASVGVVEDVADGLLDAFEGRLEEASHGVGAETQHALRRPADVATAVLANHALHTAALQRTTPYTRTLLLFFITPYTAAHTMAHTNTIKIQLDIYLFYVYGYAQYRLSW